MWMRLKGVSRTQRTSGRRSLSVGGALDEVGGEAVRDAGERAHGAGKDDHRGDRAGATGDRSADIFMREVLNFCRGATKKIFGEIVFCCEAFFLGKDTER
jgi:hypothetical protein